jgi:mutator protein MutT
VVAAVACEHGRYLVGLRPAEKRHGGLWEFPGGKRAPGESDEEALAREVREELAVRILRFGDLLLDAQDPGSPFQIRFFSVDLEGSPSALEHTRIGWFTREELMGLNLAPTDAKFVRTALLG